MSPGILLALFACVALGLHIYLAAADDQM